MTFCQGVELGTHNDNVSCVLEISIAHFGFLFLQSECYKSQVSIVLRRKEIYENRDLDEDIRTYEVYYISRSRPGTERLVAEIGLSVPKASTADTCRYPI